jgi:hypothetical protein
LNPSASRRLAWGLLALTLALLTAAATGTLTTGGAADLAQEIFFWAVYFVFGCVGLLIATRHPGNPIGWLFLGAAVSAGLGDVSFAYATYFVETHNGPPTLAGVAAKFGDLSWIPLILTPTTFLLALFPDGHLLSARWRPVAWCAGIGMVSVFVVEGLIPGPISDYPTLSNPFGVDSPLIDPLHGVTLLLVGIGTAGSSVSLIIRFRRARGEERQQIKWLALAGGVAAVAVAVGTVTYGINEGLTNAAIAASVLVGLPAAAGTAILRYRLYDIDVVINRALVYSSLTALLAGFYLGSVLLLQLALESFTQGSGLAVAASTLAAAALVRPARARIQQAVDRRFFRRKYDAQRTLERFGGHLRDKVDLEDIGLDLIDVVTQAVQPAHASLWLRTRGPS